MLSMWFTTVPMPTAKTSPLQGRYPRDSLITAKAHLLGAGTLTAAAPPASPAEQQ